MAVLTKEETLKERLGSDLEFPINGNFNPISGVDLLLQDIQLLLLTIPGERVWRPTFGCNLRNQIWENIRVAEQKGKASIVAAINKFEPRVILQSVTSDINENTDLIIYNINFRIRSDDSSVNLVFPFRAGLQLSSS